MKTLFFVVLYLFCLNLVYANQKEYKQDVNQLNIEIKKITQKLNQQKSFIKTEQHRIHALDDKIHKTQTELSHLHTKIRNKKVAVSKAESQLLALEAKNKKLRYQLEKMILQQYKQSKKSYIQMMLNQNSPNTIGRVNNYYEYYQRAYNNKIQQIKKENAAFILQKNKEMKLINELENDALQIETKTHDLQKIKKQRKQKIDVLSKSIDVQSKRLTQLKTDRKRLISLIQALVKKAKEMEEMKRQLAQQNKESVRKNSEIQTGGFLKQKKRLAYPVKGKIQYRFAERLKSSGLVSEGIFFSTQGTQNVHAIFNGTVIFADVLKGYGLLLIIDHGDNYISLYGHNDVLFKKVGDIVKANEIIAKTGTSGGLQNSGLYFEIRKNSQPIDPSQWCR